MPICLEGCGFPWHPESRKLSAPKEQSFFLFFFFSFGKLDGKEAEGATLDSQLFRVILS